MKYQTENNTSVFKYLSPSSNDKLLSMSDKDLVNIMQSLKKYYLELRDTINVSKELTFAGEIEFEEAFRDDIELRLYSLFPNGEWIVKDDNTLSNGGEINTPILRDTKKSWIDLSTVCDIVSNHAHVLDNTSGHIHIGMHILGNNPKYWRNFTKLWMTYENIITRFLYGEYISERPSIYEFAKPISKHLINDFKRIEEKTEYNTANYILKVLNCNDDKKRMINFRYAANTPLINYNKIVDKNTIEFRGPNGTFDPIIWQNNINLLIKLLEYAKNDNFDEETINQRLKQIVKENIPSNLEKYSYINIIQAIELADLIFDNNLDKMYFLRQYIKDQRVSTKPLTKSRSFTIL